MGMLTVDYGTTPEGRKINKNLCISPKVIFL